MVAKYGQIAILCSEKYWTLLCAALQWLYALCVHGALTYTWCLVLLNNMDSSEKALFEAKEKARTAPFRVFGPFSPFVRTTLYSNIVGNSWAFTLVLCVLIGDWYVHPFNNHLRPNGFLNMLSGRGHIVFTLQTSEHGN